MHAESISQLDQLSRTYRPVLMRYFLRVTRSRAEAEDLSQEVFIRLAHTDVASVASAEAYIFGVARNLVRDRSRRTRVRDEHRASVRSLEGLGVDPLDPHRVAAGQEALARVYEGIAGLPERTRRIFVLYRLENVDKGTIAASFDISRSAVDKHLARALALLVDLLGEER